LDSEQTYLRDTVTRLLHEEGLPGVMLVVRHSIRTDIDTPDIQNAWMAPLTQEGKELAWKFGRMLANDHPTTLRFSRVPRCEDTAHFVRRGIIEKGGSCEIVGRREYLEAPFVEDPMRVMEVFTSQGTNGFAREWTSGQLGHDVIESIDTAGRSFLDSVLRAGDSENSGTVSIFVTHDITLLALLSLVFDVADPEFHWPAYMGGLVLARRDPGLWLHYAGQEKPLY
jgi:broad specificity phosphatase PhoE